MFTLNGIFLQTEKWTGQNLSMQGHKNIELYKINMKLIFLQCMKGFKKKILENENIKLISIFSFSYYVFYPVREISITGATT